MKNKEKKSLKIFVTGANGQLAKTFSEMYPSEDLYLITKEELDVRDAKKVLSQVREINPDIIFHFASMTRGDDCAKNPKLAHEINVKGTKNIVKVCKNMDIALLFVSTNEVFDGSKKEFYSERDKTNPITVAGETKREAEKIIEKDLKKYYIIRTSWLFSKYSKNFLHSVLNKAKTNKEIKLVTDEISSPTYSEDLCKAIFELIHLNKYGKYHIANSGKASRFKFGEKALEIIGAKNVEITPVKLSDFKRISRPPLFTPLDNSKITGLGIKMPKWENALMRFLAD